MKRVLLVIAVAIALFGVAAIAKTVHPHNKAYAYLWQR
jgi:hypothetical protein